MHVLSLSFNLSFSLYGYQVDGKKQDSGLGLGLGTYLGKGMGNGVF